MLKTVGQADLHTYTSEQSLDRHVTFAQLRNVVP